MKNSILKTTIFFSCACHVVFLGIPGYIFVSPAPPVMPEVVVLIDTEIPALLPEVKEMAEVKELFEQEEKSVKEVTRDLPVETEMIDTVEIFEEEPLEPLLEAVKEELIIHELVQNEKSLPDDLIEQEKVISDEVHDELLFRYKDLVKRKIEKARRYPYWARKKKIEGTVYVQFSIKRDGSYSDVTLIRTSGKSILDRESTKTIERVKRFPAIPEGIRFSSIVIEVPIVFNLSENE